MRKPYLICGVELLLLWVSAYAVILPEHNCSEYFTYGVKDGENYFGLFTAPRAVLRSISWNVSFVWQGLPENPIATVQHYPSTKEAVHNINSGRRAQLIARFGNIGEQLPQLVHLQVNSKTLCSNIGSGHRVTITRGIIATETIRTVDNSLPEILPNFPTIAPKRKFGVGFKRF